MIADDKYYLLIRENLMQPIKTLLSHKQKTFSQFLSTFLKCTLNFEHSQTKDDPHRPCVSEITESEKGN